MSGRRSFLCLGLLAVLGGCGLTNQMYTVAWTANLNRPPDVRCIRDALATLPDVFRTDEQTLPQGHVVGVYLKPASLSVAETQARRDKIKAQLKAEGIRDDKEWPDISIRTGIGQPENFRMDYMGWPKAGEPRETAAQEIVQKLATACDIPELPTRVKENHLSEWLHYMFNI
jgi:hypothetical protein